MSDVECFLMEPLPRSRRWLRRYSSGPGDAYSNAMNLLDEVERPVEGRSMAMTAAEVLGPDWKNDPRWPTHGTDGKVFVDSDNWQIFERHLWRHPDGRELTIEEFPPGAMWNAYWMVSPYVGDDGQCLCVILPNGAQWMIDSRASNCDMPNDNEHKCWVRHGVAPLITVDKNGRTCNAGAGSILSRQGTPEEWHGFLRNGRLVK